jgi:hypothetical protein
MKNLLALCAACLTCASANATSFLFTDTVAGHLVTGSFDGTLSGNLITGLSNISVFVDGIGFQGNGSLYAAHHDSGTNWISGGGVASLDGSQNNFLFIDADYPSSSDYSNYFYSVYFVGSESFDDSNTDSSGTAGGSHFEASIAAGDDDAALSAPEPVSWAMMLVGFGAIGGAMRRRTKRVVRIG